MKRNFLPIISAIQIPKTAKIGNKIGKSQFKKGKFKGEFLISQINSPATPSAVIMLKIKSILFII
jgi:hypothetical protein